MHLTPEELIDLADGTTPFSAAPHLATCDACRRQFDELRDVMATLAVDVPEPSPLFWDHLSARIHDAVAAEGAPARWWSAWRGWPWGLAAAMSAAVVVLAVSLTLRTTPPTQVAPAVIDAPASDVRSGAAADDPSFSLLGDLAGSLDWDAVAEAGIGMEAGAADTAIAGLNDAERSELQRLLRQAMSGSGV